MGRNLLKRSQKLGRAPGTDLEPLNKGNTVLASSRPQFHGALGRDSKGGDSGMEIPAGNLLLLLGLKKKLYIYI